MKKATNLAFCIVFLISCTASLRFGPDGTFKIVQFTDIHYGVDPVDDVGNGVVQRKVISEETPDLVVISGDAVSGWNDPGTEGWIKTLWKSVTDPMVETDTPWAFTFGNHDDQGYVKRDGIAEIDMSYNLSETQTGPTDIQGVTNYYLQILSSDNSSTPIATIWLLDSMDNDCVGVSPGWGCVWPETVEWYRNSASEIQDANGGTQPPAIMFFHIPIHEYMDAWNYYQVRGVKEDNVCCGSANSGLYSVLKEVGDVKATFCGHDHNNDYFVNYHNITLYYGRKTGYGGYGPPKGILRGARVIEFTEDPFSIKTWIRCEDGSVVKESEQPLHKPTASDLEGKCGDAEGEPFSEKYLLQMKELA